MPLVPIESVDRTTLRWLRTGETVPEFTLLAGDSAVAILRFGRHRGTAATAETAGGTWLLGRHGFLVPHLTARRSEGEAPIARLSNRLGHHVIEVGGGGTYWLKRAGLLVPAWTLTSAQGTEVVHLEPVAESRRIEAGAVIAGGTVPPTELLLLVVLSWYFVLLLWIEDEVLEALVPLEGPDSPSRFQAGAA